MKKIISKVMIVVLLFCITPNFIYANDINKNISTPQQLKGLKGEKEFVETIKELKHIRNNLDVININPKTAKDNYKELSKSINFHIEQLRKVDRDIENIKNQYKDYRVDQTFGEQLQFTIQSMKLSLDEMLVLLDVINENETSGSDLFHSDYLVHIYFYLTLADQMIAYVDNYYNLK